MVDAGDAAEPCAREVRRHAGDEPCPVGVVLGSGLSDVALALSDRIDVPQTELPGYPAARMPGHRGLVAIGRLGGRRVAMCVGRPHLYEGHDPEDVTLPVRTLEKLGARLLVAASAAGGVDPEMAPGDLMLVRDHLNLMGAPFLTASPDVATPYVDLTDCYDRDLRNGILAHARGHGIPLRTGVLAAVRGPQYETPAEVRMLRLLGADAVCMSLVPEALEARRLGLRLVGLVVVANRAAGMDASPIRHEDVLARVAGRVGDVVRVLEGIVRLL